MVDEAIVEVFSTKMCVSCCGSDFKDALLNGEQRDIKCAASQIEDQHVLLLAGSVLLVQSIGNGCSCWLVDDAQHIKTSNNTCGQTAILPSVLHNALCKQMGGV